MVRPKNFSYAMNEINPTLYRLNEWADTALIDIT